MATRELDAVSFFNTISFANLAQSAIGAEAGYGNLGWSLVSLNATLRYVDPTDTSPGNAHRRLWTLIYDLAQRGIIKANVPA